MARQTVARMAATRGWFSQVRLTTNLYARRDGPSSAHPARNRPPWRQMARHGARGKINSTRSQRIAHSLTSQDTTSPPHRVPGTRRPMTDQRRNQTAQVVSDTSARTWSLRRDCCTDPGIELRQQEPFRHFLEWLPLKGQRDVTCRALRGIAGRTRCVVTHLCQDRSLAFRRDTDGAPSQEGH